MSDGPQVPAGWYADASGEMRYWDGRAWTEHTASSYQREPAARPAARVSQAAVPVAASSGPGAIQTKPWRQKWQFWVVVVLATLFVIGSITDSGTGDGSDPEAEPKPRSVDVEQFIGRTPDDAHNQLEDELKVEMTTDYFDLSPRGRDVNRYEDIIISADRKTVTADDPKIEFWTLTADDVKWFEQHRKMPAVKNGSACESGFGTAEFEPVDDLVFVATSKPTSGAERIRDSYEFETRQARWPTDWAETQRASVGDKWEADTYSSSMLVKGQEPKAGTALKPGQLMVIYCSPKPVAPAPLVSQTPAKNCMSGYSPCLPIVADLDCGEINHSVVVTGGDPYRLDRDGDGIGCD